ncbi:MAG: hypothetical protein E7292_10135 [Lachnospiraceae bacterium]|nr:hypothetical protein [Lachnospiraceae bacterium]
MVETDFILHAFYMGVFITFVYDILRVLRRVIPHPDFLVSVEDMGFWIYCAAKVFLMMYYESNGTLRWFAIGAALMGMFLYLKLVSPLWIKYMSLLLGKILEILFKILKFLLKPIYRVLRRSKKQLTLLRKVLKMNLKGREHNGEDKRNKKKSRISQEQPESP